VGAPSYFERRGTPERPEDLLRHECITFCTSRASPVARRSAPLRLFVEMAKELAVRNMK
jgi:hypothetical protein